ncbi:MAG TPA: alpha/beta hydrolase [Nitrososphaerales archaeon]|nr:alpha/beta hydrolase [Nitrososphaerales archaeon]
MSKTSYEKINGLALRYWSSETDTKKSAEKPTILFFHGFSFSLDDWARIGTLDLIAKEGYPVIALDLPAGKGSKSDKMKTQIKEDFVCLVDKFLEKARVPNVGSDTNRGKLIIVGPSMGGGFALSYAIARPQRIAGLVLIAPATEPFSDERLMDGLEGVEAPTMLVWGENDDVFPVETHARVLKNSLGHSKLLVIKGAGHAAYLDKPDEFNDLLIDFLEELSS